MRTLQKPGLQSKDNLIHLNGFSKSSLGNRHEQVKSQIDGILQKDYSNWRISKNKYDALNSLTAKSSEVINTYVKGIYSDYQIQDPLEERNGRYRGISVLNSSLKKNLPVSDSLVNRDSRFSLEKRYNLRIGDRNVYETLTKSPKKGLEVTKSSRESKQRISLEKEKPVPTNLFASVSKELTPQKVRFVEYTAPTPESSFVLSNSRNVGWSSSQMGVSGIKNLNTKESLMQSSKFSLQKPGEKEFSINLFSTQKLEEDNFPTSAQFKSTREFLSRRKERDLSRTKEKELPLFGSEVSLGENNPERAQQRMENLKYASDFINLGKKRTLFAPDQKIKQSFRYCAGCSEAVLQANIQFHEENCREFKRILQINNLEEILTEMDKKIEKIVENILLKQQQIGEKDPQIFVQTSNSLTEQIKKSLKIEKAQEILNSQTFGNDYQKIVNIGTSWGMLTEEVNKLKWFLLIKRNFQAIKPLNGQPEILLK